MVDRHIAEACFEIGDLFCDFYQLFLCKQSRSDINEQICLYCAALARTCQNIYNIERLAFAGSSQVEFNFTKINKIVLQQYKFLLQSYNK